MQAAKDQWDSPSNFDFLEAWGGLSPAERDEIPSAFREKCENRVTVLLAGMAPKGKNGHDLIPPSEDDLDPDLPTARSLPAAINWAALGDTEPPARLWATDYWFGFGHVTLMVGQGGIGKTLCAQQWGSALAIGKTFIDRTPKPLKVLMWACEDDHDELWRRQRAIASWLKQPLSDFGNLHIVPRHGHENTLVTTEYGRPMFTHGLEDLKQQAGDYAADVVILDNVAQIYGGNENDRHSVTMFMNGISGALPGKAIMLLAHPSRTTGSEFSGSGAWEAVARTRLYLGRKLPDENTKDDQEPEDDVTRYLCRRKANYSTRDYRRFEFNNGVLVEDVTEGAGGIIASIRSNKAERVVIEGLQQLTRMDVRATDGKTSPQYLPRLLTDYKLNQGVPARELGQAMRAAVVSGVITRGVVGRYATRAKKEGLIVTADRKGDAQT